MAKICNVCNKEFPDRAIYCTTCGNKLETETVSDPSVLMQENASQSMESPTENIVSVSDESPAAAPCYTVYHSTVDGQTEILQDSILPKSTAQDKADVTDTLDAAEKTVSVGKYFLLLFLFAIPVVGWISAIIILCGASKNKNVRNLAAALLVWVLIGLFLIYDNLLAHFNVSNLEDLFDALVKHFD